MPPSPRATLRRTLLGLLALALVAAGCAGGSDAAAACEERLPGVRPGLCPAPEDERAPAPDDEVAVLGADGETLSLASLRGQVVVVNFWASWCGPCRVEQPDLNAAHELLADADVAFVGVNIEDQEANALAHVREFDIPYPSLYDPTNAYAAGFRGVGPRTIPTTIFLDREGRVAARMFGSPRDAIEVAVVAEAVLDGTTEAVAAGGAARG